MGTFFFVYIISENTVVTCGPYMTLEDAMLISTDHAYSILRPQVEPVCEFTTEIWEVGLTAEGWQNINLCISTKEAFNLEGIDVAA